MCVAGFSPSSRVEIKLVRVMFTVFGFLLVSQLGKLLTSRLRSSSSTVYRNPSVMEDYEDFPGTIVHNITLALQSLASLPHTD